MLLADMGADVTRVDPVATVHGGDAGTPSSDLLRRGRRAIGVDLKSSAGVEVALRLVEGADALIEGFRPGVVERLGIGPEDCIGRNPRLVYGRMTGWGQDGPLAQRAGHDLTYIALSGALERIGRSGEPPVPPLNLLGDFAGGGLLLAFGLASALLEVQRSGAGQVIDAAMVDGASLLMTYFYGMQARDIWTGERGTNLLDGGAPFYDVYETADGRYLSVAALEPRFYAEFLRLIGLDDAGLPDQMDQDRWPLLRERLAGVIRTKTRDEWSEIMDGSDACVAPVLGLDEAPDHPHLQHRGTFATVSGVRQPTPAPRFSRTPCALDRPPARPGQHTDELLGELGYSGAEIGALRNGKAVA